ncbi:MAG: terminase small subunit [Proteobacteria bacterium]|nr:terminase small subunit [Pseudomonadota bacterium]
MDKELNDQQKTFCREYVADIKRNARRAAIRAGYAEKGARTVGPRLLKDPRIQEFIAKLDAERIDKIDASEDQIVRMLLNGHDRAVAAGHSAAVAKFCELLGKRLGMFKENININEPEELSVTEFCTVNGRVVPEAVRLVDRAVEILEEVERGSPPTVPQDGKPSLEVVK